MEKGACFDISLNYDSDYTWGFGPPARLILILMKVGISTSTLFQVVPFCGTVFVFALG